MLSPLSFQGRLEFPLVDGWRCHALEPARSLHWRAIDRLRLELAAEDGLLCRFHGGVGWRALGHLLPRGARVQTELEPTVRIGRRRFQPDLAVLCCRTGRPLLFIEVWHSHAVSQPKREALGARGVPWIEVLARQVLMRKRGQPLPVVDWGGPKLPEPPTQFSIASSHERDTGDPWSWLRGGH